MGKKKLSDLQIVSLATNLPGPLALYRLSPLGIKTIKIEPPWGDAFQQYCPAWYEEATCGQQIVQLNLKEPKGQLRLAEYLENSDLLLNSFRPSALTSLGLDWDHLQQNYPQLNLVEIVGFAERPELPSHDLNYMAQAGLLQPPHLPSSTFADLMGAEKTATAILATLWRSQDDGCGHRVQISLGEAALTLAKPHQRGLTTPDGPLGGGHPGYRIYPSQDGWVALAALEPEFVKTLCAEFGLIELDPQALEKIFQTRSSSDWEIWAKAKDLPLTLIPPEK